MESELKIALTAAVKEIVGAVISNTQELVEQLNQHGIPVKLKGAGR